MTPGHRVMLNSAVTLARTALSAGVALFTTRYVLLALGQVDLGLYAVIGGSVALMGFVNLALSIGAQRRLALAIGQGDAAAAAVQFNASLLIHVALAGLIVLAAACAAPWILQALLTIPPARQEAAAWAFFFAVAQFGFAVACTPFNAALTAREEMIFQSAMAVASSLLSFGLAFGLQFVSADKLICYSGAVALQQVGIGMLSAIWAMRRYPEVTIEPRRGLNRACLLELLGFSGWVLYGAITAIGRVQGPAVVLNMFFGPKVNAAYAIAAQAGGLHMAVSHSILSAISPQIVKSEGGGDRQRMLRLSLLACKYAWLTTCVWVIPVLFEMDGLLSLWLTDVPDYAAIFCILWLVALTIDQLTGGLVATLQAVGRIARYQVVVGTLNAMHVPIGYALFRYGVAAPQVMLWAGLSTTLAAGVARLGFANTVAGLRYSDWWHEVGRSAFVSVLPTVICVGCTRAAMPPGALRTVITWLISTSLLAGTAWLFAVGREEREQLKRFRNRMLRRQRTVDATSPALGPYQGRRISVGGGRGG